MDFYLYLDSLSVIAIKYTLFAVIATLFNLLFQYISLAIYSGYGSLFVAMFFGTLVGLFIKYYLDKQYIFYHAHSSQKENAKTFLLYSFMGIFTTILSWSIEYSFDALWPAEIAKYIGAFIGQILGYITKYNLDKKYVFKKNELK